MSLSEFELIQCFLTASTERSDYVRVGIGDDAAVLSIPPECELVTSIDLLNEGVHFPLDTDAYDIGYKALAVSLSDIASMGATPFSALLSLSLPKAEPTWVRDFAKGFFALAKMHQVDLVGGDVTRGPLSVGTLVNGLVPRGQALLRSQAKIGDLIYVTGCLGDAGLALQLLQQKEDNISDSLLRRLNRPTPRVEVGLALRGLANAAMDISDGLVADLEKLCQASRVGAELSSESIPLSSFVEKQKQALALAISAGDDYELLFTVSPSKQAELQALQLEVPLTCVGTITETESVLVKDKEGKVLSFNSHGYDHFKETP